MQLFDTARGALRPAPAHGDDEGATNIYVCGITPYEAAHLGHAFTYHVFDVIARRLVAQGRRVRMVRNVTDCDDDIFRVARQRGIDHRALVAEQVALFDSELASIDIRQVDATPYASAHGPQIIAWVRRLADAGFAYARGGRVYFDVSAFDRHGDLSRLPRTAMLALSRERGGDPDDPLKDDPLDFVLWQPSLPDELSWESPWGLGRPGWHIECTVMALAHCPGGIDIHGGGDDLTYPHHEAEIAQAESLGPEMVPLARSWVHVAMVGLDGVKMSKSLGNLVFIHDIVRRIPAPAVRLLLAAHHHRTAWSYSEEDIGVAAKRLEAAQALGDARLSPEVAAEVERRWWERIDDDIDTPAALGIVDEAVAIAGRGGDTDIRALDLVARLFTVLGVEGLAHQPAVAAPRS